MAHKHTHPAPPGSTTTTRAFLRARDQRKRHISKYHTYGNERILLYCRIVAYCRMSDTLCMWRVSRSVCDHASLAAWLAVVRSYSHTRSHTLYTLIHIDARCAYVCVRIPPQRCREQFNRIWVSRRRLRGRTGVRRTRAHSVLICLAYRLQPHVEPFPVSTNLDNGSTPV